MGKGMKEGIPAGRDFGWGAESPQLALFSMKLW